MSDAATADPWPEAGRVAFICDTRTRLERKALEEWVRATAPVHRGSSLHFVHVDLDDWRQVASRGLQEVLDGPGDTVLVPLRVAWLPPPGSHHAGPRLRDLLLGNPRRSLRGPFGALMRPQDSDRARCIAGASASVEELRKRYQRRNVGDDPEDAEDFATFVVRQTGIALDVEGRKLRGRRYKVPRSVIAGLESSARYRAHTGQLAARLGRDATDVRAEARRYLSEFVATPTAFFIDYAGTLAKRIVSLGYREVVTDPDSLERARTILRDYPSALLWTHKSHVDAIALLSVMYEHDFPAPHSIGGINMAFAGVGYAGRRSGTIYIRRSFNDNPVYKVALQQYLGYLMEKRFPLSWAFEGTRSRNGKLGPPRYGLLKYVIDAAHATHTEDLHLIPVSITYDLIGETSDYAREESGQPKESESLGWFMDYLRRLRSPMGNIYLDFAEPLVLEGPAPEPTEERLAQVAFEVARRVNAQVPVTLPSLMCMALLGAAPRALTYAELDRSLRWLMRWLREREIRFARSLDQQDLPELEGLAESVFSGGVVERVTEGEETLFCISDDKYPVASYYRNTIIHYFVNKAIAEVALVSVADHDSDQRAAAFFDETRWLRDLTKFDFFHTPSQGFAAAIEGELAASDVRWRDALGGSRGDVHALLSRLTPLVSHAVLLPYLEAYWLVAKVVADVPVGEAVTKSETVASALRLGHVALRRRRISSEASIGKAMFNSAVSYLADQGLLEPDEASVAARRVLTVRLDLTIRRVRQIAELAHAELFGEADLFVD